MWVICCFDLPVTTKKEQKIANDFRKLLLEDGFLMLQYSIYGRHCPSSETAQVHIKRVQKQIPENGSVLILKLTDKQFGESIVYVNKKKQPPPASGKWVQLELF